MMILRKYRATANFLDDAQMQLEYEKRRIAFS